LSEAIINKLKKVQNKQQGVYEKWLQDQKPATEEQKEE